MAIDVSYRDTYTTSAQDLSRFSKNFLVNEGVANGGLAVSQSGTPAMSVDVAVGTGYFYGSGSNSNVMYEFISDAVETVTIGVAGVQARIDIICLKVDPSTQVASIVAIAGTPSGSPAVPATPASHYKLAEVAVGISVTTITNANITDRRRSVFVAPTGARNQGLINGYIIPTVTSNNLTLSVSTSPTSVVAPSVTNPVGVWIGGELRFITSALTTTANAGTNWLNSGSSELATREIDYFAFIGLSNTNNLAIGVGAFPYYRLGSQFNDTATNQYYGRFTDTTGTVLTTTTQVTSVVNVGRFAATLSAGAGFTWSVPTYTNDSLIQEPCFSTRKISFLPVVSSSMGITVTNVQQAEYIIDNNCIHIFIRLEFTLSGTASSSINCTIPRGNTNPQFIGNLGCNRIFDAGNRSGIVADTGGSTTFEIQKHDSVLWTLGTARYFMVSGTIPLT